MLPLLEEVSLGTNQSGGCERGDGVLLFSSLLFSFLLGDLTPLRAQTPPRNVHPSIAPPAPGAITRGAGPMFQIPDGVWNHGEGFRPGSMSDHDSGGWHGLDDGTGVEPQDVHSYHTLDATSPQDWSNYAWIDPLRGRRRRQQPR